MENKDDIKKETPPVNPTSETKGETSEKPAIEVGNKEEDVDFESDLKALEEGKKPAEAEAKKDERQKAEYTLKSVAKRLKTLGGDPEALLKDEEPAPAPVDTSKFVTKAELALAEAQRLARSPAELKVIMWYIENNGLSVEEAHLLANKGKITKAAQEIARANSAVASPGGGGAGQKTPETAEPTALSPVEIERMKAGGMVWVAEKKAWVGKHVQLRFDVPSKKWVSEKVTK